MILDSSLESQFQSLHFCFAECGNPLKAII